MKIFLFLFMSVIVCEAFSQDITGKWYGYPDMKNSRLRLNFEINCTNNHYSASLQIPDQSDIRYNTTRVALKKDTLYMHFPEANLYLQGICHKDSIQGFFSQNGYRFPLQLSHTPIIFKRPQTPYPPFPHKTEELVCLNPVSNIHLAGTLSLPEGPGPFKTVVFISGSGPNNRDSEAYEHKPFLVIADYLARHGIASLRLDDRGTGLSEGDFQESSIKDYITDIQSALRYLKTRPEIQTDKIGVIGHSEGGFVAFNLAARQEVAFIITLAAGGVNGQQLLLMQRAALLKASGAKEELIRNYNFLMAKAQEIALQSTSALACEEKLQELLHNTPLSGEAQSITWQLYNPEMLGLLSYDPAKDFPQIKCPVLALNGTKDWQVPVENLEFIKNGITVNGNSQITAITYPGLNHLFQTAGSGLPIEYSMIEETISPQVLKDITNWIRER